MGVITWLLDGDPAIRWQTEADLIGAPTSQAVASRAEVAHQGWGARLLAEEDPNGLWAGGAYNPIDRRPDESGQPWTATIHTMQTLVVLGLDPESGHAQRAVDLVARNARWEHAGQRYFDGEVEPCINGRVVQAGAYFGVDVSGVVDRLLTEQLADGGWNCEAENGSVRSSFDTTINVVEGLLAFEHAHGPVPAVAEARERGEEYLLERGMFRRLSTGEVVDPKYLEFAFPYYWHYDVLRGLDHMRLAGRRPDPRMAEAVEYVRSRQGADGRWPLDRIHPGRVWFDVEVQGAPSRANTLRALRVLAWWGAGPRTA